MPDTDMPPKTKPATRPPAPVIRTTVLLQVLYLSLAVAGILLPWQANLEFMKEYGAVFDLQLFTSLARASAPARSLSSDLLVGAAAVVIWMVHEGRRLKMRSLPWILLGCFTVAFAFAAPLFLFLRERRLLQLEPETGRGDHDKTALETASSLR